MNNLVKFFVMLCLGLPIISSQAYGFSPDAASSSQYDTFDVSQFDLDNNLDILVKNGVSSNFVDLILDHNGMTEKEKFLAIQDVANQLLEGHSNISLLIPDPKLSQEELMALHRSDRDRTNSGEGTYPDIPLNSRILTTAYEIIGYSIFFIGMLVMVTFVVVGMSG
ncbi:MAG: hypothetical protein OXC44_00140 [Proteobacteria bacterium]|nr:hypothetical protein [Pseudomonadota bacterium]